MPSETFNTPGRYLSFTVPAGVSEVQVELKGAGSGSKAGGLVTGRLSVTPGQGIGVVCGEQGKFHSNRQPGEATWGGGGKGGFGRGNGNGGDSGGGASWITVAGGREGSIVAIAGGAGGTSGDGGDGGRGGAYEGENGTKGPGTDGGQPGRGGEANLGGAGGTNPNAGPSYDGQAGDPITMSGGKGGQVNDGNSHGGGGGGGGYGPGGGGNASGGSRPASGGGGGANYTGRLTSAASKRGEGSTSNGSVKITWENPPPPNLPPPPPTDVKVNGVDLSGDITTNAMDYVVITALLDNPDGRESSFMAVRIVPQDADPATQEWNFQQYAQFFSDTAPGGVGPVLVSVGIPGLAPNTKYFVRCYTVDSNGTWSQYSGDVEGTDGGYVAGSFWTNRPPSAPELLTPSENTSFEAVDNIFFSWTPIDADDDDAQTAWELRTRRLTRPNETTRSDWQTIGLYYDNLTSFTVPATWFTGNQFYLWSVRTADKAGVWSDWSTPKSFFVDAATIPPVIDEPRLDSAITARDRSVFTWEYRATRSGAYQTRADIRYRTVGAEDWVTLYGDTTVPGTATEWVFPQDTFIEGYHYEWAVRTTDDEDLTSDWSEAATFWATAKVGTGLVTEFIAPGTEKPQPALGCGINRVFVFDRGARVMRGEITGISSLRYNRKRDDVSGCSIFVTDFSKDCGALLSDLRCWQHEVVVFRDGKRVWEGPITRIDDEAGTFEIEAKDVMVYLQRRIMRQGYNDTYRVVNGIEFRGRSVVERALTICRNALAYDDPNVMQWITAIRHSDDSKEMRAVPDYAKMAWEEIDDLAATGGLDYTVAGRRIILWDTHRALGRLPEMRDGHFSQPVHITEYGMQLANLFGVTNNDGVYGVAYRALTPESLDVVVTGGSEQGTDAGGPNGDTPTARDFNGDPIPPYYGWIEQLVSAFGETEGEETATLTDQARADLEETLRRQAQRGIASRWPAPVVVRVPDNATIQPDVNIGFDQLVPGVWIPVRATGGLRSIAQWQKLDSVVVSQTGDSAEQIAVTMSPAPNAGQDPDADAAAVEA